MIKRLAVLDFSNIQASGSYVSAARRGLARDPVAAQRTSVRDADFAFDFEALYALVAQVSCVTPLLIGSRTPSDGHFFAQAQRAGFEVLASPRRIGAPEVGIDHRIAYQVGKRATQLGIGDLTIVSGDGGFSTVAADLRGDGVFVRVMAWEHSLSARLRSVPRVVVLLDRFFDQLRSPARRAA